MKSKKYCYLEAEYPKSGYIGYIFATNKEELSILYPFPNLYNSTEELAKEAHKVISYRKDFFIPPEVIILPVQFDRLFELKKEYWDKPTEKYDIIQRSQSFVKPLKNYNFYELLVTPWFEKDATVFTAGVCFSIASTDREVESFMLKSNMPVDIKAKHAALYTFERPFCYELQTQKITPVKNPILQEKTALRN